MESQLTDQPPDLRSLLRVIWRRKWLFLAIFVSIPAVVYVISNLVPKTYEAAALVRLEATRTDVASLSTATVTDIDTEALLLNTEKVAAVAAEELGGGPSAGGLGGAVRTEPLTTDSGSATDLLYVVAEAEDADDAADFANAYARAIDTVRTEKELKQLDKSIAGVEAQLRDSNDSVARTEFNRQLQLLRAGRATAEDDTEVVQNASPPSTPVSPHPRRNTALAALVALLLALGAVALAERLDRRLRDSSELEPLLDAPLLSVIPRGAFPGEKPAHGPVKEAFRTLAASLVYFNVERPVDTVVVSSPTKGDGKTTVAVHLAVALARDDKRAILIDCDLRHPQVAVRLGIEPAAGVVDVLTEQAYLADALVDIDVGEGRLQVLAAGTPPPNPARLLGSQRMDSLLEKLSKRADVVIVDTPPILNVSDAIPLLERVSGTVVIAKVGATSKDAILRLRQVIETSRGNILGTVATGSAGSGLYGYGAEYYGDESEVDLESPLPEAAVEESGEPDGPAEREPETTAETEPPPEADVDSPVEDTAPEPVTEDRVEAWVPSGPRDASPANGRYDGEELPERPATPTPAGTGPTPGPPPSGQLPPAEPEAEEDRARNPASIIDQPTQEWDPADGWGAAEERTAPERWKPPETWDDPEAWDSPDED